MPIGYGSAVVAVARALGAVLALSSLVGCSLVTDLSGLSGGPPTPEPADVPAGWLKTDGNQILWWDDEPFQGRGANVHDTRSCWACAWEAPNPAEVERRMDWLLDEWHGSFVRVSLESYAPGGAEVLDGAVQWQGVLDDAAYLGDLQRIVRHVGDRERVAVLLSLWVDPTLSPTGLPTDATRAVWERLAETFAGDGHVIFGLVDGPAGNTDGVLDAQVWEAMNQTVATIREVETRLGVPPHLIAVQGTREGGADLRYYVEHPIEAGGGQSIVYDAHIKDRPEALAARVLEPAATLPVIVGAFSPAAPYTLADCGTLMDAADARQIPYLAWTFHESCTPSLVEAPASGAACAADFALEPTAWGQLVKDRLATAW